MSRNTLRVTCRFVNPSMFIPTKIFQKRWCFTQLNKRVSLLFIVIIIFAVSVQSNVYADSQKLTSNVDGLNIRMGPSQSDPILEKGKKGDTYKLLQKKGDWFEIQLSNGAKGWVASWLVTESHQSNVESYGTVTVDRLNLRSAPQLSSRIIKKLEIGEHIKILQTTQDWVNVLSGNEQGWVSSQYVQMDATKNDMNKHGTASNNSSNKNFGKVTVNQLNVRSNPSLNGTVIVSVNAGNIFEILEESNDWVKIKVNGNKAGWVASWYVEKVGSNNNQSKHEQTFKNEMITILQNGTNLRSEPTIQSKIIAKSNSGDTFSVIGKKDDWYKLELPSGEIAYVASWIVSSTVKVNNPKAHHSKQKGLKGKTIVIDPGHGGRDSGTIGYIGTLEKNVTLVTAELLYKKLKDAGANVILTRYNDRYVPLPTRAEMAQINQADAFISLHYDSINDQSITGHTTYYYHSLQKLLAQDVNQGINNETNINNRGVRFGDFHVIRENEQPAILLELGYLSNPEQEAEINSHSYQDQITTGIYNGLVKYFK
ncbi:N-acetylmuramoyl-L-alanine amidase [Heyndrickxia sporothermodurans]